MENKAPPIVTHTWLPDLPVSLEEPEADQFGVRPLVEALASLVNDAPTPLTISLSGGWGVGKSTVAEGIVAARHRDRHPACIVDAWTTDVQDLRRAIALEVGAAIRGESARSEIAKTLDTAVRVTRSRQLPAQVEFRGLRGTANHLRAHWQSFAVAGFAFVTAFVLAALIRAEPWETVLTTVAATLAPILVTAGIVTVITPGESEAPAAESVAMSEAFRTVVTDKKGGSTPVLVVVDNLDRLAGGEALIALGQIRSLVEIKGSRCVFVVPIDRGKLAEHISDVLGGPGGALAAGDYLQKFFNLEISLADPEPLDLAGLARRQALRLFSDVEAAEVATAARIIASAAGRVPRAISRLLNGLSTRFRVLKGGEGIPDVELTRLAFVEGLVAVAPVAAESFAKEPRRFIQARLGFDDATQDTERSQALSVLYQGGAAGAEWESLRRYLIANADIALTASDLRVALVLREDRMWNGVDDPGPYVDALESGDADAFVAALETRTEQRGRVIERSVQFIQARHENGLLELALLGIRAMTPILESLPQAKHALFQVAAASLPEVSARFTRSLGDSTLAFIHRHAATLEHPIRPRLADVVVANISYLRLDPEPVTPLVDRLREIGAWVTRLDDAREALKDRPDEELEPLFQPPPLTRFVEGPVANSYVTYLLNWSPTLDEFGHARSRLLAQRLSILRAAGWDDGGQLAQLAVRTEQQLPAAVGDEAAREDLADIAALLSHASEGPEIESLAAAMARQAAGSDEVLLDAALGLPIGPTTAAALGAHLLSWASSQKAPAASARIQKHREKLEAADPTFSDQLISLWILLADPGYAELAVATDEDVVPRLAAGVTKAPQAQRIARAADAVAVAGQTGGRAAAVRLEDFVAEWIGSLPIATLTDLPALVAEMRTYNVPRARLVEAVADQVPGATAAELDTLPDLLGRVERAFGAQQLRLLAESVLNRLLEVNGGAPATLEWAMARSTRQDAKVRLLVQAIARGSTADGTIGLVSSQVTELRHATDTCEALVARAYGSGDRADAERWIEAAIGWSVPSAETNSEFHDQIASLRAGFPDLNELIDQLEVPK